MFILLIGCPDVSTDEKGFADDFASLTCERLGECLPSEYERAYGGEQACLDDAHDLVECYSACEFQADVAKDCLDLIYEASCGEIKKALDEGRYQDCEDVFACEAAERGAATICAEARDGNG